MNETKYLPIGTICTINSSQRSVMIIGYKPVAFEKNELNTYDYKAVYYPEGSLAVNSEVYFNHLNITKVIYNGYRDSSFVNFNKAIGGVVESDNINIPPTLADVNDEKKTTGFKFDENGFVIEEEEIANPFVSNYEQNATTNVQNQNWDIFKDTTETNSSVLDVPLQEPAKPVEEISLDENKPVVAEEVAQESIVPAEEMVQAVGGYRFDENGNVIADEVALESVEQFDEMLPSTGGYKFDENGNVIADEVALESVEQFEEVLQSTGGYKFDENGNVITDEVAQEPIVPTDEMLPSTGSYRFDENGNVIADEVALEPLVPTEEMLQQPTEVYNADVDNTVAPEPAPAKFKYDENGVVISE